MTDKEKLTKAVKLADAMYYAAQYLTTDASRLHKAMEEYHQFIIHEYFKEEPVSEDLEEEIKRFYDKVAYDGFEYPSFRQIATYFAKWQKEHYRKWSLESVRKSFPDGTFILSTKNLITDDLENRGLLPNDKVGIVLIKNG